MKFGKWRRYATDLERRILQLQVERDNLNIENVGLSRTLDEVSGRALLTISNMENVQTAYDDLVLNIKNLMDRIAQVEDMDPGSPGHSADLRSIRVRLTDIIDGENEPSPTDELKAKIQTLADEVGQTIAGLDKNAQLGSLNHYKAEGMRAVRTSMLGLLVPSSLGSDETP